MAQVVTKDMIIADILAIDPGNAAILMAAGMIGIESGRKVRITIWERNRTTKG